MSEGGVRLDPLLGVWANTDRDTALIQRFVLARQGSAHTIHASSAQAPQDWGAVEVTGYMDNVGELAFHATYEHPALDAVLAANCNKGLLIVASFITFKDQGATPNLMRREFFHRVGV